MEGARVLSDDEPLPPASRDAGRGYLSRHAAPQRAVRPGFQPSSWLRGTSLRKTLRGRGGRERLAPARGVSVHRAEPGSSRTMSSSRRMALEQLPRHGWASAMPPVPHLDAARYVREQPRQGTRCVRGIRDARVGQTSITAVRPWPGAWPLDRAAPGARAAIGARAGRRGSSAEAVDAREALREQAHEQRGG